MTSTLSDRTVGWIGTGVMGLAMAERIRAAGADLLVTTRTRARAEPLLEAGARWVETPPELLQRVLWLEAKYGTARRKGRKSADKESAK